LADVALTVATPRRTTAPSRSGGWASVACVVAAAALWVVTVRRSDYADMQPLGLVTILGPTYFLGLAILSAGFAFELVRGRPRELRLVTLVVALVVYLFGTPSAVEPVAALTSSWGHAGFVNYVALHGHALNGFDAEFSWPGTFSAFAIVAAFMGKANVLILLRWFPLGIELAYLAPLVAITRASGVSRRVGWLGIAIFYGTDWIYQDYFSPQAVNYLFYLCVVAVVLTCWRPVTQAIERRRPALRERLRATREALRMRRLRGEEATTTWPSTLVLGACGMLVLLFVASAMSHQLTPYAIVLALLACLLTRRLGRPELPVIAFLLAVGWLSLGASNYWLGHLSQIFGSIFQFATTVKGNVGNRVTGSSSHRLIVDVRILLTAALFGFAAIGAARRATATRTLEVLAVAPFFVLAGQSYGGEGLLRVALLSGPFAGLLAASALLPGRQGALRPILPPWRPRRFGRVLLAGAIGVGLLGATATMTVVRGGNDYYETFAPGELAAVTYAYLQVANGKTIGLVAPYEPIGQWRVDTVHAYAVAAGNVTPTLAQVKRTLLVQKPQWIVLGQAQEHWGEVLGGYKVGWMAELEHYLIHNGHYIRRFSNATAVALFNASPTAS
jgi:hypothetical protein